MGITCTNNGDSTLPFGWALEFRAENWRESRYSIRSEGYSSHGNPIRSQTASKIKHPIAILPSLNERPATHPSRNISLPTAWQQHHSGQGEVAGAATLRS